MTKFNLDVYVEIFYRKGLQSNVHPSYLSFYL